MAHASSSKEGTEQTGSGVRHFQIVYLIEAAYIPQDTWELVIRPALADQRGSAFFISTPAGYNHFHEMWEQAAELDDWQTFSFSTIEGGNVPPERGGAGPADP